MTEKERKQQTVEIEHEAITEINHETSHPGRDETRLQQDSYDSTKGYLHTGVEDER